MLKRGCTILVLTAFLAVASGLALDLHLHDGTHDDGPDGRACTLCNQLMQGPEAPSARPALVVEPGHLVVLRCQPPAQSPEPHDCPSPACPRAPPTA